jgi:hypothetical protein
MYNLKVYWEMFNDQCSIGIRKEKKVISKDKDSRANFQVPNSKGRK